MESNNNIPNNLYYQPPMLNDIYLKKPEILFLHFIFLTKIIRCLYFHIYAVHCPLQVQ